MNFAYIATKGTKDPRRLVIKEKGYGPNWYKQRKAALERDGHKCQKCGYQGKKKGRYWDVHVHHRIKIKSFVDMRTRTVNYQEANDLENLVTLCRLCHKWADGHDNGNGFRRF